MAETFKNAKLALTTSSATIYTCPPATTAIVLMAQMANKHAANEGDGTVTWIDSSDSNVEMELIKNATVVAGSSLAVVSGKFILEAGDSIKGLASAIDTLVITLSILEIS